MDRCIRRLSLKGQSTGFENAEERERKENRKTTLKEFIRSGCKLQIKSWIRSKSFQAVSRFKERSDVMRNIQNTIVRNFNWFVCEVKLFKLADAEYLLRTNIRTP